MTICLFGNYLKDYGRVVVLRRGFEQNGVKVLECHTRERGFKKYWSLYRQHRALKNKYDLLLVMMGGQTIVWFAKIMSAKKLFYDAFVSLYVTNIEDRENCRAGSFRARYYAFLDRWACQLADKVLLDTNTQIDYFVSQYKIPHEKFIRVFVGADENIYFSTHPYPSQEGIYQSSLQSRGLSPQFSPLTKGILPNSPPITKGGQGGVFLIHWHGYIVPFYSVETIVKAAEILKEEEIEFRLVTRFNSKYEKIKKTAEELQLDKVKFYPECTHEELARYINEADICLGIFGNNLKARLVIPNKIFEAVACAKPIITARLAVINGLFVDGENIILVEPENARDLAEKILELKKNSELRKQIGGSAGKLFQNKLTAKKIVSDLLLALA